MEEFDVPYRAGLDRDDKIFAAYRFSYQPATVLVTRDGGILRRHFGGVGEGELDAWVRDLIAHG